MATYTANQVSINNGSKLVAVNSNESPESVSQGDFIQIANYPLAEINRTFLDVSGNHVIELVKIWKHSDQISQPAIVLPTTVDFKATVDALKKANILVNDNTQAMQDWQTKLGEVTFRNIDETQTTIKTLKQMESDFNELMARLEAGLPTKQGFEVDKIVMLGASITNHSTGVSTVPVVESYLSNKYGKYIPIINEAVSGWLVQDVVDNIDAILDKYNGQSNVVAYLHIGGGNIGSTFFLDNSPEVNQALFDGLNYIYDAAEARGIKLIQAALTFRDYYGTTIRNDPEEQKLVEKGSYSYNRDWIVEVMKQRAPDLLRDNWPVVNQYDVTRNIYREWVDFNDPTDTIHPSHLGRLVYLTYAVDSIMQLSQGILPPKIEPRNFDIPFANATESLDVVYGFAYDLYIDDGVKTDNINWIARSRPPVAGTENIFVNDTVSTDGSASEIKLHSYVNYALRRGEGNISNPADSSATLTNNTLLLSALTVQQGNGYLGVIIEGLQPNANYEVQFNAGVDGTDTATEYCTLNGSNLPKIMNPSANPPESNIISTVFTTDHSGKAYIAASEANDVSYCVMGGLRIKTIN